MRKFKIQSLAGHSALMISGNRDPRVVRFSNDVKLISADSGNGEFTASRPEITGHLDTSEDYSETRNATLALQDGSTFDVWFFGPQIFAAQFHPSM